jgi:hypothetical protein
MCKYIYKQTRAHTPKSRYLSALNRFAQILSLDLTLQENQPEDPPPREPEPEDGAKAIPKRALDPNDPACNELPVVPGPLKWPVKLHKTFVQASRLACRVKKWTLMLNAAFQVMSTRIYVCKAVCLSRKQTRCVCVCVCIYIYIYIWFYVCVCMYACIRT